MKKFLLWLIKIFKVNIVTEKIVEKEIEKYVYLPANGVIEGDIVIKGNVLLSGNMKIEGNLTINNK